MGSQNLGEDGQPVLTDNTCPHGIFTDDRGNVCCERCWERSSTANYKVGIAVAYEELATSFRRRSGEAFSIGQDDLANNLRKFAAEFELTGKNKRAEFKAFKDGTDDDDA